MAGENNQWMEERIGKLHRLLQASDYKGRDPFDLSNSPLLRIVPSQWALPQLVVSKFGSRLAPDWLRHVLRIPPIEDPKTYSCAYFAYRLLDGEGYRKLADTMLERLVNLGRKSDGTYWGYGYIWPTMSGTVNPRGASTIVPGSFAMMALAHESSIGGDDRYLSPLADALSYYSTRHRRRNSNGPFLGYFTNSETNTHNANLLGCAALSLGARVTGDSKLFEIAAEAAETSLAAVRDDGYIVYSDHSSGEWTDCFHHLYVAASLSLIQAINPQVDRAAYAAAIERLDHYYRTTFIRPDGLVNYYPGGLYPVDPHNFAATAIYRVLFDNDTTSAIDLLERIDKLTWDDAEGRYIHRIKRRGKDRRLFIRWTQVWMFLALAVALSPEKLRQQLAMYETTEVR